MERPPQPSTARNLLFAALAVTLFFGLVELVLALAGIRPLLVEEDPYVGFAGQRRLFEADGDQLRTAENKIAFFNRQSFPVDKGADTFRIFTLGGSTTYGRPFEDPTSFSGWLRTYLPAVDASRPWEVVNAGGISYASYRVALLMEELLEDEPDLFIIYSGHNEFLEKRTYSRIIAEPEALRRTRLVLEHSRLWALGRKLLDQRREAARERYEMTGEVEELLNTSVGLDHYVRDDPFEQQVLDHYRYNLQRMVSLAESRGVPVILVTLPVNEKDMSPFKSEYSDEVPTHERSRHAELLRAASAALAEKRPEEALELTREAVGLDPRHADGQYLRGRALFALGRYEEAEKAFDRAIEEDVCPLRALAEVNAAIAETAAANGVPLVDFRALLDREMREAHGHTILGEEHFFDHVHLKTETHGLLARSLVATMAAEGFVRTDDAAAALASVEEAVRAEVLGRVDTETQAIAYKNLSKVLLWAGKKEAAERYLELAGEVFTDDWELHYNAGIVHASAGRFEEAVDSFREAARLNPQRAECQNELAGALAAAGRLRDAIAAAQIAVAVDPKLVGAWVNLGTFYSAAGNLEMARDATRKAIALDPRNAEAHNNLGKFHFDSGDLGAALASYERAVRIRPNYPEALTHKGLVLGGMGRYTAAIAAFQAALRQEPGLVLAHFGMSQAHLANGDTDAAAGELENVLRLAPGHLEALQSLASILITGGQPEKARQVLREGVRNNPDSAPLHYMAGRLAGSLGDKAEALKSLRRAVELAPDLLPARIDLGTLYIVEDRIGDAVRVLQGGLETSPGDGRLHHVLGTALIIDRQIDKGREHLEKAVELQPSNALAVHDLAAIHEQLDHVDEALALYRRAAGLDPRMESARQAVARLSARRD